MFNRRRQAQSTRELVKQPICGCGHHWSHHDGESHCHATLVEKVERTVVERYTDGTARLKGSGTPVTSTETETIRSPCTCQRYYGPEPYQEFIVPPLAEIEGD